MTATDIRHRLSLPPESQSALERLESIGPPPAPVDLPDPRGALARLRISDIDIAEMLAARPDPERHPELWWLLERCCHELQRDMGGFGTIEDWPVLSDSLGAVGRFLYPWVFLATIPALQEFHASRHIPDDITWETMAELAGQLFYHRAIWGSGGLRSPAWITAHFRGVLYRIGRLVYERQRVWFDTADGPRVDDRALGVHIPRGKLTPESCDESVAMARDFFARHFPDEQPLRYATCVSWLLDPQLLDHLAPDTNILRFQRRFRLLPIGATQAGDQSTVESIFARRWTTADDLPGTTTLERAIGTHLRTGGHWYFRTGWFEL